MGFEVQDSTTCDLKYSQTQLSGFRQSLRVCGTAGSLSVDQDQVYLSNMDFICSLYFCIFVCLNLAAARTRYFYIFGLPICTLHLFIFSVLVYMYYEC